jgi:hypothetical protein
MSLFIDSAEEGVLRVSEFALILMIVWWVLLLWDCQWAAERGAALSIRFKIPVRSVLFDKFHFAH